MAAPAAVPAATPGHPPAASIAKSCSSGFTRGRIGGAVKCLRRGEYCAKSHRSQYRRYGYVCRRVHGVWRLQ